MDLEQELKELVTAAREGGIPLNTIIKVLTEETVALTSEELEETDAEDAEDTPAA